MAVTCFIPNPGTQAQPVSGLCSLIWTELCSQTSLKFIWFSSRLEKLCKNVYRLFWKGKKRKGEKKGLKWTENETNFLFPCSLGIVILSISLHTATAMDVLKTAAHFRQTVNYTQFWFAWNAKFFETLWITAASANAPIYHTDTVAYKAAGAARNSQSL